MTLVSLGVCAGSIYVFFLAWALLQERLTTTPYRSDPQASSGVFGQQPDPEYFRSPLLLNWTQATLSTLVAAVYLQLTASSSSVPRGDKAAQVSLLDRLGLAALTPSGAERIRKQGDSSHIADRTRSKQNGNGHAVSGRTSKKDDDRYEEEREVLSSSSLPSVSPLLFRYLLISALQSCSSQLGLHSLAHGISYPTLTLAKSCKLVPVLLMNVVLYRRKFPRYKYFVVALVTIGISIFMLFSSPEGKSKGKGKGGKGSGGDSLIGVVLLLLNLILDGATNSTQDEVFHRYSVTGPQMMLVMNALSSVLMGASLIVPWHALPFVGGVGGSSGTIPKAAAAAATATELASAKAFIARHPQVLRDLLAYAAAGAVGQVAIFETLQRFGSLTLVSITVSVCAMALSERDLARRIGF